MWGRWRWSWSLTLLGFLGLGCGARPLDSNGGASGGAPGSGGASGSGSAGVAGSSDAAIEVGSACGCSPGGGITVLACGQGFPSFEGRDAPEAMVSASGDTVVFNQCVVGSGGGCTSALVRWTAATGPLQLDTAWAYAVSADGTTILADAGDGNTGSSQPILWTGGNRLDLGVLAGAYAHLLSGDGLVVAAQVGTADAAQAALWRANVGLTMLGDLAGGAMYSEPEAMNSDSSVVVGYGNTAGGQEPFLWTATSGTMLDLGAVSEVEQTVGLATSDDGSAVAGTSVTGSGTLVFRWTAAGGMVGLTNHFDAPASMAFWFLWTPPVLMSSDGTVVAGTSTNPSIPMAPLAFRWTASGVAPLTGTDASIVRAASSDGSRILGARVSVPGLPGAPPPPGPPGSAVSYAPFVWDAAAGAQDLGALLQASGADLTGLTLGDPIAMSADGSTIVGHATCGADTIVFRAVLPP
jgi:uncharacterized membrane protein